MDMDGAAPEMEELLARELVRDAASADDVLQETWLAALERPPRGGANVRGWLARAAATTPSAAHGGGTAGIAAPTRMSAHVARPLPSDDRALVRGDAR